MAYRNPVPPIFWPPDLPRPHNNGWYYLEPAPPGGRPLDPQTNAIVVFLHANQIVAALDNRTDPGAEWEATRDWGGELIVPLCPYWREISMRVVAPLSRTLEPSPTFRY